MRTNLNSTLMEACGRLTASLHGVGISKAVYDPLKQYDLPDMSDELIQQTAQHLITLSDLIDSVPHEGELNPTTCRMVVDAACSRFDIRFEDSTLPNHLSDGDVLEVFSKDHRQLFATPNLFELTSYDMFALACWPWNLLFIRPKKALSQIESMANHIMENRIGLLRADLDSHVVAELMPGHERAFDYYLKFGGCVIDNRSNEVIGYASIIEARIKTDS